MNIRRILGLALLAIVVWVVPAQAALAVVQRADPLGTGGTSGAGAGVSIVSSQITTTAGNGLVVLVSVISTGGTVTGLTNVAGDTNFAFLGTYTESASIFNRYEIWCSPITLGATNDKVTAALSGSTIYRGITVYEISGQLTSSCTGGDKQNGAGSGTAIASASVSVTATQEIIFAIGAGLGYPITGSGSYTLVNFAIDGVNAYTFDEYHIVTASEAAVATGNTSNSWAIFAGSFKVATPVATSGRLPLMGVGK